MFYCAGNFFVEPPTTSKYRAVLRFRNCKSNLLFLDCIGAIFFSFQFASFSFKLNLIVMLVLQVGDKLYIYLEFVSGGSIYKLLQEYGQLGELAIRSYTQQILSGLAYLHGKKTVHR